MSLRGRAIEWVYRKDNRNGGCRPSQCDEAQHTVDDPQSELSTRPVSEKMNFDPQRGSIHSYLAKLTTLVSNLSELV
jgi:hypothetical protein